VHGVVNNSTQIENAFHWTTLGWQTYIALAPG